MGLFSRLFDDQNATVRYISDSSYWLYLAHLPLIIMAQQVTRLWQLPALLKFTLICLVVTAILLLVYEAFVRYSWLGTLLNGPRRRPTKAIARAAD